MWNRGRFIRAAALDSIGLDKISRTHTHTAVIDANRHRTTSISKNQAQQRRIQELERINVDLERRLEQQARERMKVSWATHLSG